MTKKGKLSYVDAQKLVKLLTKIRKKVLEMFFAATNEYI